MTIEITKKLLIIFGVILAIILCVGVGGYLLYSAGYKKGHSLGIAETEKKYENPKGDGSVWYAEPINNGADYLYHSTTACPNIRNGINENWGFRFQFAREQHSQFCPKCMDSDLINMCKAYLYTTEGWGM